MGKETEYKLEVGDLQLLDCILCSEPVASRMQAPFIYIRMQTTYYDTEDGLLEKNRWMLRLRTENERSVVTMKTPGEGHTRGEWEVESEYLDEALPALAKLGAPEAIGRLDAEVLLPVCGAKFTRITAPLRLSEKTSFCASLSSSCRRARRRTCRNLQRRLPSAFIFTSSRAASCSVPGH